MLALPPGCAQGLSHRHARSGARGGERRQPRSASAGSAGPGLRRRTESRPRLPLGRRPRRAVPTARRRARSPSRGSHRDARHTRGARGESSDRHDSRRHGGDGRPVVDRGRLRAPECQRHRADDVQHGADGEAHPAAEGARAGHRAHRPAAQHGQSRRAARVERGAGRFSGARAAVGAFRRAKRGRSAACARRGRRIGESSSRQSRGASCRRRIRRANLSRQAD